MQSANRVRLAARAGRPVAAFDGSEAKDAKASGAGHAISGRGGVGAGTGGAAVALLLGRGASGGDTAFCLHAPSAAKTAITCVTWKKKRLRRAADEETTGDMAAN